MAYRVRRSCAGSMKYPCSFNCSPSKETNLFISGWWWEQSLSPSGRAVLCYTHRQEEDTARPMCFVLAALKTTVRSCGTSKAWLVKYDHCSLYGIHIFLYKCFNNQLLHLQPGLFFPVWHCGYRKQTIQKKGFFFLLVLLWKLVFLLHWWKTQLFFSAQLKTSCRFTVRHVTCNKLPTMSPAPKVTLILGTERCKAARIYVHVK